MLPIVCTLRCSNAGVRYGAGERLFEGGFVPLSIDSAFRTFVLLGMTNQLLRRAVLVG